MSEKFRVVSEDDDCFVLEDRRDGSSFKMAKKGMGPELVIRVKKMAEGGLVPPPEFVQEQPPVQSLPNRSVGQPALDPNHIDPELQRFQQLPQLQKDLLPPADRDRLYKADRDWQDRPKPKQLWEMNKEEREAAMNSSPVPAEAPPAPSEARTVADMGGNGVLLPQSAQSAPTTSSKASGPASRSAPDGVTAAGDKYRAANQNQAALIDKQGQDEAALIQQQADEEKAFNTEYKKAIEDSDRRSEEARKAFLDKKIDPNRYYNNKSTPSKIASALAIGLGAFGSGITRGPNFALDIINKAIDADIDAQKEEKNSLKEGWQMTVQDGQRKRADLQQMKIDQKTLAQSELQRLGAMAKGPTAKANAEMMNARLELEIAQDKQKLASDRAKEQRGYAHDRDMKFLELRAKSGAMGAEEKKDLNKVEVNSRSALSNINKLRNLVKKYGTQETWTPGVKAQIDQARHALAIDLLKTRDPGSTATGPEVETEKNNIFEPGFWQRESNVLASLDGLETQVQERRRNHYQTRGITVPQSAEFAPRVVETRKLPDGRTMELLADGTKRVR